MTHTVLLPDEPNVEPAVFERLLADATFHFVEGDEPSVLANAPTADAIVAHTNTPVPAEVFASHPSLEIVARLGTGVDNIDHEAAAEDDVWVTNVPLYSVDEVATHALSLLLGVRRSLLAHDQAMAQGAWDWTVGAPAPRLVGSTVGVVSFGSIAQRFVELLSGLEVDVLVYDPYVDDETVTDYGATKVDFETILDSSNAVSVHAPLTPETAGMFDAEAFSRLSDHAVIVNVGRGGIIDEDALVSALEADELAGAGLDVFAEEPPTESPLLERDDVICTPHAAWYSEASKRELNETAARNVAAALGDERPPDAIDLDAAWLSA
ncbi:C-terminal binding protein [Halobacteria archaeon AArc-curdl1]|uniref:C-terminal binding protein n=1 Tax=Natronosalvus hydrolyticus TaxID=2979988 RepID=A0AAP3E769_9EURY|nr:C-terminal binding protein [Halobacteria archaeon AArc-curdl1]